jgi:hypothetical protein
MTQTNSGAFMPRIMLTGPHAIGKSATATNLANLMGGYFFVPSFAGAVAKKMNFDLNKPYTPEQLIAYQRGVLDAFLMSYEATAEMNTVYDRSPLDFLAYMALAFINNPEYNSLIEDFEDYEAACLNAVNKFCDYLILPEADLAEAYEHKHNRPKFDATAAKQRLEYTDTVKSYFTLLDGVKRVITVPFQYQYEDRVNYILKEIANG